MHKDQRWWLFIAFLWIEGWLALPTLPAYVAVPGQFGPPYIWSKVWAMTVIPAAISLILAIAYTMHTQSSIKIFLIGLGTLLETLYIAHHVDASALVSLGERWISGVMALTALSISFRSNRQNAPPALEILASAALALTFIARPWWSDGFSLAVLTVTTLTLVRHRSIPS